jgi:L-talarate/galactarate dehydratase
MKAKRAGLSVAKLIGAQRDSIACYNTSGGFLNMPLPEVLDNVAACRAKGIGGIKIKVGQPDLSVDVKRVTAVRELLGVSFPLMVDANQQWDRPKAQRACRALEPYDLTWIEEPLDAYDIEGHAALAASFDTAIATGEMLTSFSEHAQLIMAGASDFVQPDAPRVGGITPFLQIMNLADFKDRKLAPHFAMEIHVHLAACFPQEPWLEHFEWLEPLFNERMQLQDGRMIVPTTPGLGLSLSGQALTWTRDSVEIT